MVVISAGLAFLFVDLRLRSAPELTAPNDEGVFEETALFQVGEQGSAGAVRIGTKPAMASVVVLVGISRLLVLGIHVVDLDKADS